MLTILDRGGQAFCDGFTRRQFLQIGGLALGGMSMSQILAAQAKAGTDAGQHKAIIMIFLAGGPPHQDMFDIKTEAPSEIRGEFQPIQTSVPGIEICEHFPRMAQMMEKLVPIRTMVGADGSHSSFVCNSGYGQRKRPQPKGGWPALGSVLSKLYGPVDKSVPPFVGLAPKMGHMEWADPGQPGYLGRSHAPFQPDGQGMQNMVLNGVTLDRLADRKAVLGALDRFRRQADAGGMMEGMDSFTARAFDVLTSSKLIEALDINREDPKLRERYGKGDPKNVSDGGPRNLEHFIIARRLVEAGVRCVTLAFSRWDWHGGNFNRGRHDMPMLDQGVTALVEDLENRGMLDDVTVVVWGEFGRTPRINKGAGRDHWPQVSCALLAGGGMRTGQVIGETNRLGEVPKDRPVHFQEVFATLYRNLGIDIDHVTIPDLNGRPRFLVEHNQYQPLPELI